ncbi:hypothetical protein [Methylobacterium trifolii]|uniref:Uncharacterized protein n=1 Tax=Methylobacterium trifolii TaxID=1003092 RepID=A0ABQ4TWI9_9HYPH|nr:hypothetical protein [Methylobacterium trifolii]GJE59626.1 hypothetical protein MPOCJGCO_1723 [Methylobacterium trifolii]
MSNGGGSDFLTVGLLLVSGYFVLVWVGGLIVMAVTAAYFIALFLTFALSALAILTWDDRVTVGRLSLGPEESRPFLLRGVAGGILLPAFAFFCEGFLGVPVPHTWWTHLAAAGYALGSLGVGMIESNLVAAAERGGFVIEHDERPSLPGPDKAMRPARNDATDLTPHDVARTEPPKRKCQCFTFATWDDEEELRGRGKPDVF